MTRVVRVLFAVQLIVAAASPLFAQAQPREGRLLITVVDQTRAVIPNADVTVTGLEDANKAMTIAPAKTSDQGVATIAAVPPGRYLITAEFPGFEPGVLKDVRVRAGDNKQMIVLAIQGLQDSVTVSRDKQESSADRRGGSFGTALTRDQVDALSDDPTEMAQQLQDMTGGASVIRVDSFEGGQLPPKAMIKSIHVTRDAFAAENHSAGGLFIDIITQPGLGPLRGGGRYNLRDGVFSGTSPFTPVKGPERSQNFGTNFAGTLVKDRASFNLSLNGSTSFETPNIFVETPGGVISQAMQLTQPRNQANVYAVLDYAVTKDQTLRVNYNQNDSTQKNLGIGGYDSPERAYNMEEHNHTIRVQEVGPLGRRAFVNTRLEFGWSDTNSKSLLETRTVRVNDAFNNGGAQVAGGREAHTFNLASDLDYVRSIHSVRTGVVFAGGNYRSNDTSNYLGTYTFSGLTAYELGLPQAYTLRVGDPNIDYFNMQASAYIQDDIRVRKGLTITPGLRYEVQTHLSDHNAFGPRMGITWSPFKSGKTTLRASAGVFTDWLPAGIYEQTLRVDGVRQKELNIANPPYPDIGSATGVVPPISKYTLADDLQMAKNTHVVFAGDRREELRRRLAGATYAEIAADGGGILGTVIATRAATEEVLAAATRARLDEMLRCGTTTCEAKSGYALTTEGELKILRTIRALATSHAIELSPTFMGAHEVPAEYRGRRRAYVDLIVREMIPAVAAEHLAEWCDVFCETGVFTPAESREILEAGRAAGLEPRIHADELALSGGSTVAADVRACSADHLIFVDEAGADRLAAAGVVATLLPIAAFYLKLGRFAPARMLIERGVAVALATDVNPGAGYSPSMPFAMALACFAMNLTFDEALVGATINAACALNRQDRVGSLEPGKQMDAVIVRGPAVNLIRIGTDTIRGVVKRGRLV